jgi:hypothetical protein
MRIALAVLLIPFLAPSASLTGAIVDATGSYLARAPVQLDSGTTKYQTQTDEAGVYQFASLPAGQYTLTSRVTGFRNRTVKSIVLADGEQKRIPDISLDRGCDLFRDLLLLPSGGFFGRLSGSVFPPVAEVDVALVCRTFRVCASTKTDANGRFSFDMLSAGFYGLNFRHEGFYPLDTALEYTVEAGWESNYNRVLLEQCPKGNCDPKLRLIRAIPCE